MGRQIEFAQSRIDEAELVHQLTAKQPLLAVPRILASSRVVPQPMGECEAVRQVLFLPDDAPDLVESITPLVDPYTGDPVAGEYSVDLWAHRGRCIEWRRSTADESGAFLKGRLYFDPPSPPVGSSTRALRRLFDQAGRWIRNYPKRTPGRHAVYVGPDLVARIEAGTARLVWSGGADVELVDRA